MTSRGTILITRSEGDAEIYADIAEKHGYDIIIEPMLRIEAHDLSLPDLTAYQSLIFTSGHAVDIFAQTSPERSLTVFTVGDATADKARAAGFKNVFSAAGTVDDLIVMIKEKAGRALYLRGYDIARELPNVDAHILYKAHPADGFSVLCEEKILANEIRAALFFSARGAENFTSLILQKGLESSVFGIKALCLSSAVLESLSVLQRLESKAAATPDRDGMMALLAATLDG
jgi:uroporphyrinogen-III synthase